MRKPKQNYSFPLETNEKLCYEIAKDNPDKIMAAYQEVLRRLIPQPTNK